MDMKESKRILTIAAAAFLTLVVLIYAVSFNQFRYQAVESDALSPSTLVGEITDETELLQSLVLPAQRVTALSVMAGTYGRENAGELVLEVLDASGNVLAEARSHAGHLADGTYTTMALHPAIVGHEGERAMLRVSAEGSRPGSAVTLYAGSTVTAGRFDIAMSIAPQDMYTMGGQQGVGRLCVKAHGVRELSFYKTYWLIVGAMAAVLSMFSAHWWKQAKQGKNNPLVAVCTMTTRYRFLIKQLVSRDFKLKYKRSALGVVWSFLNPLLTMTVQYIVFSTLFRNNTPNYPVYLLTGIVFFGFFTQTASAGLISIRSSASLIKKVYLPKYIYPLCKVGSTLIDFLITLIPLMLVMLVTGTPFRPSLLLLVYDILCMTMFVTGMALILATANTFFQDTQFLWGVVSMMWMYMTPIFYNESIIPAKLLTLYHMNPMYQYVTFARVCIINGASPAPTAYLWCLLSGASVLALGAWVFKKNQDKFILQL